MCSYNFDDLNDGLKIILILKVQLANQTTYLQVVINELWTNKLCVLNYSGKSVADLILLSKACMTDI